MGEFSEDSELQQTPVGERAPETEIADRAADISRLPEHQRKALALVAEGEALVSEYFLADAIDKYRAAVTHWEHPTIHYNVARLLNALERPLEAYESVERALRLDLTSMSLTPEQIQQIQTPLLELRDQLRGRLVELQLSSAEPSVEVTVGNQVVSTASSRPTMLQPGDHRLTAQSSGYWPLLQTVSLEPGTVRHLRLTSQRAITPWKPWALASAGIVVTATGLGLYSYGRAERADLAARIDEACDPGCTKDKRAGFDDDWRFAHRLQRIGIGSVIVGGSAALLGAGLVLWNQRPKLRLSDRDERALSILPVASPEMTGLVGTTTF